MDAATLAVSAVAVLVLYQGYVTYRVAGSLGLTRGQKIGQCILIWILPIIGAVIAHIMLGHELGVRSADRNFTPQSPNDAGPMD